MPYFSHHVFFCCNQRAPGAACCADYDAQALRAYAKDAAKKLGLAGVRINQAGCLGRCDEGPVIVVYPEGIWYTYVDKTDIDEILREHLQHGRIVERLRLPDAPPPAG